MTRPLPTGTVTFVFTDIEGSTRLLEEVGDDRYGELLTEHHRICRVAWAAHGGVEVDTAGDAFFVAFPTASGALAACVEAQEALRELGLAVRIGVHTGEVTVNQTGYVGLEVHRAARIAAAAHGGQVVVSSATAALTSARGLLDLGEHRFKDLAAPERVFQLGNGSFEPLRSLYRTNLPIPATSFLGREREVREVVALLCLGDVGLVTLTGPGGTGKTRIALQAAAEVSDSFPDGLYWVPLASLRDPALVLSSIGEVLGVKVEPGLTLAETLTAGLRAKRPLLVIDNAEHLLPELASVLATFRRALPTATLLVTSRERLQLAGEEAYAVPGLADGEGVDLFLERARALDERFEATPVVAELCGRLDQLPLALELAAARTVVFSPEQLLVRLDQRLDLLKGGRDADPRQHTLRATIAWSYHLLDEPEQRLFRRLAVFVGGCAYEAAEEVADADPDTLQSLLDKSLLRRSDSISGPRYWMLETIREYATERLAEAGELDGLCQRHLDYYARLVQAADAALMGPQQRHWLSILEADAANWRAALVREVDRGDPHRAAEMAAALAVFWWFRGRADEGLPLLQAVLERGGVDARIRVRALVGASDLAAQLDLRQLEQRFLDEALRLFEVLGDADGAARTCANYVWWAIATGDVDSASLYANRSLAGLDQIGTAWIRSLALVSAGAAAGERGDHEEAEQLVEEALPFARESGNPWMVAVALGSLGWLAILAGNYSAAGDLLTDALSSSEPDDHELIAIVESNLGLVDALLGLPASAATHFRASLSAAPTGNRRIVAETVFGLAGLAAATRPESAVRLWSASVSLLESCGSPLGAVLPRVEEAMLTPIRSTLDQGRFDRLWEAARSLALPAVLDLAMVEAESLARST